MNLKKKVRLLLIILAFILSAVGCTEIGLNSELKEQQVFSRNITNDETENLKVHFIDVGQGSSAFIIGAMVQTLLL